jgi:hypothetical protein
MDKFTAWLFGDYDFSIDEVHELMLEEKKRKSSEIAKRYYNKKKE